MVSSRQDPTLQHLRAQLSFVTEPAERRYRVNEVYYTLEAYDYLMTSRVRALEAMPWLIDTSYEHRRKLQKFLRRLRHVMQEFEYARVADKMLKLAEAHAGVQIGPGARQVALNAFVDLMTEVGYGSEG